MTWIGRWTYASLALAACTLTADVLGAQDPTGSWQGTLATGQRSSRLVLHVARETQGRLSASLFNLDGGGFASPSAAYTTSLADGVLTASFATGTFEGTLRGDGAAIAGTWTPTSRVGAEAERATARSLTFMRPTAASAWRDTSAHRVRFVPVERDVQLEVLDWGGPTRGGSGRTLVLLAGMGNNAHVFDQLAPKLTDDYRVYAITRRGFAPSSIPTTGYLADSLADDVLAVLDSLRLERPVLVGHSLAGAELSSIGSRRPERVSGLVYLDAGWQYAFYDPAVENNATTILPDVQRRLAVIFDRWAPISYAERAAMIREMADTTLPVLIRDFRLWAADLAEAPNPTERPRGLRRNPVASAIFAGSQRFTRIQGPVLALYVAPAAPRPEFAKDSASLAKWDSVNLAIRMRQISAFQRGVPQARVVRLRHANHYVWRSHEADVLRELRAFVDALPGAP